MNWRQLREFTKEIRIAVSKDGDDATITALLERQMSEIYRIVAVCLSIPPETFTWEYYDKSKNYHKVGPITPLAFYEEHVKPLFNVEDKVSRQKNFWFFWIGYLKKWTWAYKT